MAIKPEKKLKYYCKCSNNFAADCTFNKICVLDVIARIQILIEITDEFTIQDSYNPQRNFRALIKINRVKKFIPNAVL